MPWPPDFTRNQKTRRCHREPKRLPPKGNGINWKEGRRQAPFYAGSFWLEVRENPSFGVKKVSGELTFGIRCPLEEVEPRENWAGVAIAISYPMIIEMTSPGNFESPNPRLLVKHTRSST